MSYLSQITHPCYGSLWCETRLRNWACMHTSAEFNLGMGPMFETHLLGDYLISSSGETLDDSLAAMESTLDAYARRGQDLHRDTRAMKLHRAARWLNPLRPFKWWKFRRAMADCTHPVRELIR